MQVLGIETSCDETAAAVVRQGRDGRGEIRSSVVHSQIAEHSGFGGVVPEIAARAHLSLLDKVIERAMAEAGTGFADLQAIAVTSGPGLIGGLITGLMTAKALSAATGLPFYALNHLEGHALTPRLTDGIAFPYLLLLVSGGHTQFVDVRGVGDYRRIATTIDDALGEAFDKTAKLLGLGYPGGPAVERMAGLGDPARFDFPRPLTRAGEINFSFAGLKTAVRQQARELEPLCESDIRDLCASFQAAVTDVIADRARKAMAAFSAAHPECPGSTLVIAGGVAANRGIRARLEETVRKTGWRMIAPPLNLCTDNAAVMAWAGLERIGRFEPSDMSVAPRSRWPLDENTRSVIGSGRRGAKA